MGVVGRQMLSQLLLEMDLTHSEMGGGGGEGEEGEEGEESSLVVVGATNTPWALDESLLRAGRLEHCIYIPPPERAERQLILRHRLQEQKPPLLTPPLPF